MKVLVAFCVTALCYIRVRKCSLPFGGKDEEIKSRQMISEGIFFCSLKEKKVTMVNKC